MDKKILFRPFCIYCENCYWKAYRLRMPKKEKELVCNNCLNNRVMALPISAIIGLYESDKL